MNINIFSGMFGQVTVSIGQRSLCYSITIDPSDIGCSWEQFPSSYFIVS